jgi:hypothetical protein
MHSLDEKGDCFDSDDSILDWPGFLSIRKWSLRKNQHLLIPVPLSPPVASGFPLKLSPVLAITFQLTGKT